MFNIRVPKFPEEAHLKKQLEISKSENAKLKADLEYVAMMTDVEMEEEDDADAQPEV